MNATADADTHTATKTIAIAASATVDQDSNLLDDLTQVWGNSVGLDPDAATAIILTVAGGIAGNSIRINAPMVGELGPDLQLAVVRDPAPALCRGLQRLLAHFEGMILDHLKEYEHLSSDRAQRNELSALESQLNLLLIRGEDLEALTNDEGAMMNLAMKCQEAQVLVEYEEVKRQVVFLRSKIRALRFQMRPMVMVSHLGIAEFDQIASRAYDSAVLEVATTPGHLGRMALLKENSLTRLSAFRRNSGCASRLEYYNGEYRPRSAVTTLLLAGSDEIVEASSDRLLRATGIIDEIWICRPMPHEFKLSTQPDPGGRWSDLVNRLFSRRLDRSNRLFSFDDEARNEFLSVRKEMLARGESNEGMVSLIWRESGPALAARLALCARLFREEEGSKVSVQDVKTGARLALRLLDTTSAHWQGVSDVIAKRGFRPAYQPPPAFMEEDPVTRMVGKLKKLAPCSMRTLFRNYARQNYAVLQPVLERAIELNLVRCDGHLLSLVGSAVEAVSVAASVCHLTT